jgi:nucleoside-diphosphate-sugar epimerase
MNVLVTGGTGFIGSRLAHKCIENDDTVCVLGQENTPAEAENIKSLKDKGIRVVLGAVTEQNTLSDILKGVDVVYHLAAAQHEMNIPDQRFWEVNVEGTRNLLEISSKVGVKRFVHGSTIGVYGILNGEIDEDSPCDPDNIYGVTKLEGEKVVLSYKEKLPVVAIRIPETYGPGDRRLLKLFKAIQKQVFFMIGGGNNLHHLIYVDDLIDGFFLAKNKEKAIGNVFLLAGEKSVTTNEMVGIIADELGTKIPRIRAPLPLLWGIATLLEKTLRPLGIQPPLHRRRMDFFKKSFYYSLTKSVNVLGFTPKIEFKEGVKRTAEWYKSMGYL